MVFIAESNDHSEEPWLLYTQRESCLLACQVSFTACRIWHDGSSMRLRACLTLFHKMSKYETAALTDSGRAYVRCAPDCWVMYLHCHGKSLLWRNTLKCLSGKHEAMPGGSSHARKALICRAVCQMGPHSVPAMLDLTFREWRFWGLGGVERSLCQATKPASEVVEAGRQV